MVRHVVFASRRGFDNAPRVGDSVYSPGVLRQGAEILLATTQRSDPLNLIQFMLA